MDFAAYARTSDDELADPAESLRWQLAASESLVGPRGGQVVAIYHDTTSSRSIPWSRRPEATRLLADLARPAAERGWEAVVIGEPQRAFSGPQFGLTFPLFVHHGVALWVPEVGGPIGPDDEAHDLIMNMFAGLSRAERNRLRARVRGAMRAMVATGTGRFLGGRPPYGYSLVRTGQPHPNPKKASQGVQLTKLVPDPDTAPVVQLIFDLRAQGLGFRAIASQLDQLGHPSPSAHDPARNQKKGRPPTRTWAVSAVRAILINPRYKGTDRFGRYRKTERLLDVGDVAAGNVTRMVSAPEEQWVTHDGVIPALVSPEAWEAAQPARLAPGRGPRPDRSPDSRYALRGLLWCGCGRRMQGNTISRQGGLKVHYRCSFRDQYPGGDHPRGVAVAESRILPALDSWLGDLFAPDRLEATVAAVLDQAQQAAPEPPELRHARRRATDARERLGRYVAAVEAGMDPGLLAGKSRAAQAELAAAEAVLAAHGGQERSIDTEAVRALLSGAGAMMALLAVATPDERRQLYSGAGLRLDYQRADDGSETVRASLAVEFLRVGEGT